MNVGEEVMYSGKWIRLKKIHTKFPDGSDHVIIFNTYIIVISFPLSLFSKVLGNF